MANVEPGMIELEATEWRVEAVKENVRKKEDGRCRPVPDPE